MNDDSGWRAMDAGLAQWIHGVDVPSVLSQGVTHLATHGGVIVIAALALLAFGRDRTRRTGAALTLGLVAHVVLLELVIKNVVARERPFAALGYALRDGLVDPSSYSFPSGHTAASFLGAWVIGARFPRLRGPLLAVACLIGLSRVQLGAHYPTDVLAGAAFGLLLGLAVVRLVRVEDLDESAGEVAEFRA